MIRKANLYETKNIDQTILYGISIKKKDVNLIKNLKLYKANVFQT